MGGFFLTNSNDETVEEKVLEIFRSKKMNRHSRIRLGEYDLFYFDKIYLKDKINHIFKKDDNYIVGVGTFFYNDKYGQEALEELYQAYTNKGKGVFNDVKGHFNFVLFIDNELKVITDKTGTYHSYIFSNNEEHYISTSLFALANNSHKLSIRKQEIMEFISTQAMYCGNTLFKEICYLPFGYQYIIADQIKKEKYFTEKEVNNNYSIDDLYERIKDELVFLKDVDLEISAETSAGFDTRTIISILKNLNIPHTYNTNYNSWDKSDHEIAIDIAKSERRPIKVIEKDYNRHNYDLINECMYITEIARDIFISAYTPIFFKEKAKYGDIIIGGYGGELYRDKNSKGIYDFNDLLNKSYYAHLFEEEENYKNGLKSKFMEYLGFKENEFNSEIMEKIYYFIRMMYWGGSRISAFNQYCYRYHPLLDYRLIYPLFKMGQKKEGKLQMRLIEKFDFEMSKYNSNYGYNLLWKKSKPLEIKLRRIYKKIPHIHKQEPNNPIKKDFLDNNYICEFFKTLPESKEKIAFLNNSKLSSTHLSRLYTIQYIVNRFTK